MSNYKDLFWYGILLFASGLGLNLFIGNRKFNRRNQFGLDQFDNYFVALIVRISEHIFWLGGVFLILIGIFSVVLSFAMPYVHELSKH